MAGPNQTVNMQSQSGARGAAGSFASTSGAQGAVARGAGGNSAGAVKTAGGDVYAGADGNVYKKTDSGWEKSSGGAWAPVTPPSTDSNPRAAGQQADSRADPQARPGAAEARRGPGAEGSGGWQQLENDRAAREGGAERQRPVSVGRRVASVAASSGVAEARIPLGGDPAMLGLVRCNPLRKETDMRQVLRVKRVALIRGAVQQKLEAQQGLVDALSDYSRLARLQYQDGFVPYSTVLQADQQFFPAQLTLAQYRAQVFSAAVSVYQALGGGWVTLADEHDVNGRSRASTNSCGSAGGPNPVR